VSEQRRVALITGASRGLGRAVAAELLWQGWRVVIDARDGGRLREAVAAMPAPGRAVAVPGDVADPVHRGRLAEAVGSAGRLDLLVNNASELGPSPLPRLVDLPVAELERVLATNVVAPLALIQLLAAPLQRAGGAVVNVSSDAGVEAYAGWGGYGASKAALDQLTAVAAVELPGLRVYALDPGDMATDMHRRAFPGEDIGDRPAPESVAPAVLRLLRGGLPSGRYRAADLGAPVAA
jgi:NAD(P)-dependent dehydrogenase (short-subunit alcohol dehydrogenase family)